MGVDPKLGALANAAPNFGYLLTHEPLLVSYGAALVPRSTPTPTRRW